MKRIYLRKRLHRVVLLSVLLISMFSVVLWQPDRLLESNSDRQETTVESPVASAAIDEPIQPIPLQLDLDENKVKLGEKLFHDPKLSGNNTISCASCHNLQTGGTDRLPKTLGINGAVGDRNSPTVFNSGFNFKQFWDGRSESLAAQVDGPLNNPIEMGSSWPEAIGKLQRESDYVYMFDKLYPDGIKRENIRDALATFVQSLYTPNSRFDKFLRGDTSAITESEKEGYRRFKASGCVSCHQGVNVGGNMFQTMGIMADYFGDRGEDRIAEDAGRFNVTGDEGDRQLFKVPSLRNIALTAPYFHDGSAPTLEGAVAIMAKYQLGRQMSSRDIEVIVKFLHTLTGEYKGQPLGNSKFEIQNSKLGQSLGARSARRSAYAISIHDSL
ncbi:MAG: cytochrome-c peroxidase [Hormoscilla sp.]